MGERKKYLKEFLLSCTHKTHRKRKTGQCGTLPDSQHTLSPVSETTHQKLPWRRESVSELAAVPPSDLG